jgi:acyl-CoA thioester hydrolase
MRYEIPAKKALVHSMTIPMRWGDMDAMGHLNNTTYFRFLETARIDWLRALGCDLSPAGEGVVIVNAFCNFYKQFVYPCDVLMKMYVSDVGEKTFETWGTMAVSTAPDVICAAGGATTVWVDFPKEKSKPMPDWFRQKLLAYPVEAQEQS